MCVLRPRFAAFFLLAMTAVAHATDDNASCNLDSVQIAPPSVIEPCTILLQNPNLSAAERATALFIRGKGYHRTQRLDLAQQDYDAALTIAPQDDGIYVERANISFRYGRFAEGVYLLKQALTINPKNAHALRSTGALELDSGRVDDAIRDFDAALGADPEEAHALLFRSKAYEQKRQFGPALDDADALVAMPPEGINRQGYLDNHGTMRDFHIMALEQRADIYAETGRYELAERDLDAAVDYKWTADALVARGQYLMGRPGQAQAALRDLANATSLDPDHPRAFYLKGRVLAALKRPDEAFDAFDRAVTNDPHYDYALRMRAIMHRERGETELAVSDLERAMSISARMVSMTIRTLQHSGYWDSREIPNSLTPQLKDAIRACMLDTTCN
jgi:tetratricopeptide (TPR) repeat protein